MIKTSWLEEGLKIINQLMTITVSSKVYGVYRVGEKGSGRGSKGQLQ